MIASVRGLRKAYSPDVAVSEHHAVWAEAKPWDIRPQDADARTQTPGRRILGQSTTDLLRVTWQRDPRKAIT